MTKDTEKTRELTDKQKLFLKVLMNEAKGNLKEALKLAGYEATTPSEIVKALGPEIRQLAEDTLAVHAPAATLAMIDSIFDPNSAGAANKIKAAQDVLDRVGIVKKTEKEVKLDAGGGLIILPAKEVDSTMLDKMRRKPNDEDSEV
jgi:hypothetical protein